MGELESAYGNLGFFKDISSTVPFIFRGWENPHHWQMNIFQPNELLQVEIFICLS